ncbi:FadR/GntR family transcriptional regulator [Pseudooceanicola sp. HF7]|uniref:FadR/GntR family transcriptional regulator n=1 Tax=Pseudooceanicola sp. HF7 TaxID=2721560 RepID=UPI0014321C56|nr:FadR/GntR family transcriptional regulator [Pseudooceanicola sp. HF7]NIZ11324.1 FadR family transcriptional regulator [Pseudooceanicola sp. HF7]
MANDIKSRAAPRGNLVADVVDTLRSRIESDEFSPGDRLPSEAKLTEEFSVSRTVIREAIAALRADGLVQPRQGAGVFVLEPAPIAPRPFQIVDTARISSIVEMLELRIAVEMEAAALAAARRSPAQEEQIYEAEAEVRQLAEEGKPTTAADLRFHLAVADATNNPRFREFLEVMGLAVIPRATLPREGAERSSDSYISMISEEHRAIADAIAAADANAARDAMRRHLQGSQARYRRLLRGG